MDDQTLNDLVELLDGTFEEFTCHGWNCIPEDEKKEWINDFCTKHACEVGPAAIEDTGEEKVKEHLKHIDEFTSSVKNVDIIKFDKEHINNLLDMAQVYYGSMRLVKDILKEIGDDELIKATINVDTGVSRSVIDIDKDIISDVLQSLVSRYKALIRSTKQLIDKGYESIIDEPETAQKPLQSV